MVEKISREELAKRAWLAGILEGDGWFALNPVSTHNGRLKGNRVEIGVCNNDVRIIQKVSQIWFQWGVKFSYSWSKAWNNNLRIVASGYGTCLKILEKVLPYTSGKRSQVVALLAFIEAHDTLPRYFHKDPELLGKFITLSERTKQCLSDDKSRQFDLQRLKRTASKVLILDDGIV